MDLQNLSVSHFIPHGHCYLWQSELVGLHLTADALIALAYFSIPVMLVYFVQRRRDLPFSWIFLLFGAFIISCGITHLMEIWTLWNPDYWVSGFFKIVTATLSVSTAIVLYPLTPQLLAFVSPVQLETMNSALQHEIIERHQVEAELRQANAQMAAIFEAFPDLVFQMTADGTILDYKASRHYGLYVSPENFLGKRMQAVLPPHIGEKFGAAITESRRINSLVSIEYSLTMANGEHHYEARIAPFQDNQVISVIRDITERKMAEKLTARLIAILDATPDLVGTANPDGYSTYINRAGRQMLGIHFDEDLSTIPIADFTPPEFLNRLFNIGIPTAIAEGFWNDETAFVSRTGQVIPISQSVVAHKNEAGELEYISTIARDISERKLAEAALRKKEQFLRTIYDGIAQAVFVLAVTEEGNLRYTGWNPACVNTTHIPADEVIGQTPETVFGEALGSQLRGRYMRCLQEETTITYEECIRFQEQGLEQWWLTTVNPLRDESGKIYRMIVTATDITERKQAEEALRQSEAQYRELAQREALINLLASQIRTSLNLDTILEITVQEIHNLLQIDLCVFTWYRPHYNPPTWEVYKEAKNNDIPSHLGCYTTEQVGALADKILNREVIRVDRVDSVVESTLRDALISLGYKSILGLPLQTQFGKIGTFTCINYREVRHWKDTEVELLCAVRDQLVIAINQAELYQQSIDAAALASERATQLEQALIDLKRTQSQLIQNEKMAGLGQLVAGVAHEINNPVSFIFGNVSHAQDYAFNLLDLVILYRHHYSHTHPEIQKFSEDIDLEFLMEDFPRVLDSMKVGAARISEIVRSLRIFSRLDESEVKNVDIHEGIDSTLMILNNRLKAQPDHPEIQVIKEYGLVPKIQCYAGQINQVFMNIIANAIDALDEYNRQRTEVEIKQNPSQIKIQTKPLGSDRVAIYISDNGPGIVESVRAKIFDPFFTTKSVGYGTGLGLSISYQIVVEKHKGKIECLSEEGKGSTFIIEIPV